MRRTDAGLYPREDSTSRGSAGAISVIVVGCAARVTRCAKSFGSGAMAKTKAKVRTATKAARRPSARRKTVARSPARAKAKARPRGKQRFTVSHPSAGDFAGGLRRYAKYRDLGISAATNGLVQAHVVQFVPPCRPEEVSKLHYHDVEFQMVYVLKGSIKTELEGQGAITMREGSCWIQPPRVKHKVLDYSDDCQVLEIVLPADFKTVELE
jgi:mannose-6-phosphate isomerase-like protein (cupin superfamily)